MRLKDYPYWPAETLQHLIEQMRQICNVRKDDIIRIQNFDSTYVMGRTTYRVPSGSADIVDGDKVGDVVLTSSFVYYLVDNGTPQWVRATLGTF